MIQPESRDRFNMHLTGESGWVSSKGSDRGKVYLSWLLWRRSSCSWPLTLPCWLLNQKGWWAPLVGRRSVNRVTTSWSVGEDSLQRERGNGLFGSSRTEGWARPHGDNLEWKRCFIWSPCKRDSKWVDLVIRRVRGELQHHLLAWSRNWWCVWMQIFSMWSQGKQGKRIIFVREDMETGGHTQGERQHVVDQWVYMRCRKRGAVHVRKQTRVGWFFVLNSNWRWWQRSYIAMGKGFHGIEH